MSIRKKISQVGLITLSILTISCVFIESEEKELLNNQNDNKEMSKSKSIYNIKVNKLDGTSLDLKEFKGRKMLFVNVASKCGYTPQYAELQKLYDTYKDQNFVIVGFPANNFGGQEPGTNMEIAAFCKENYGVTFPMMSKISVKGADMHEVYHFLTEKSKNGLQDSEVSWNFQKYLLNEKGELAMVIEPRTLPTDPKVVEWIETK